FGYTNAICVAYSAVTTGFQIKENLCNRLFSKQLRDFHKSRKRMIQKLSGAMQKYCKSVFFMVKRFWRE
ncbi:MAG: hypothetical protein J6P20_02215, partial [Oscillospiraceae bacterium]|nr:hypothetical protein [Oscillospiraceae bacterium]